MILKITTAALSASACLMFSTTAFAGTSDIKASNNQFGFQFISMNVDYTETDQTGMLDTETGSVFGSALYISTMKDLWFGNDYIEAEYDNASGNTEYVGGLIGPPPTPYGSVVGTSGATLVDYSARYGKGFIVKNEFMLTPYVELGHHEWDRGVNWGEVYTHNYLGIGAMGQYSPVNRLVLSANALIGSTFGSYITANSGPGLNGFSGALGNSSLYRIGASADYALAQNLHGNIGIDYIGFSYGMSAVYGGYFEPDSKTNYTTVKMGLGYGF